MVMRPQRLQCSPVFRGTLLSLPLFDWSNRFFQNIGKYFPLLNELKAQKSVDKSIIFYFCNTFRQYRGAIFREILPQISKLAKVLQITSLIAVCMYIYKHTHTHIYSDTSANEDDSFRNHIRQPKRDFPQVSIENRLIRSGCCQLFEDKFYKTVKSTL